MSTYSHKDGYREEDLIQYGIDHLDAAKILFGKGPRFFDSAGHLGHLGIELLLKAWHPYVFGAFEGIHGLVKLYDGLRQAEPTLSLDEEAEKTLELVDAYALLRYPRGGGAPEREDDREIGDEDWQKIEKLSELIWRQMPETLVTEAMKIEPNRKGHALILRPAAKLGNVVSAAGLRQRIPKGPRIGKHYGSFAGEACRRIGKDVGLYRLARKHALLLRPMP